MIVQVPGVKTIFEVLSSKTIQVNERKLVVMAVKPRVVDRDEHKQITHLITSVDEFGHDVTQMLSIGDSKYVAPVITVKHYRNHHQENTMSNAGPRDLNAFSCPIKSCSWRMAEGRTCPDHKVQVIANPNYGSNGPDLRTQTE